ncbi:TPA: DUF2789 domain-containing protein [Stenotrophomonas maltophilia]|uniref:DUF2789 domain-containing protein n=1 Tax=Stenotrophomonas TaxID=40323 RepID=UPI0028AD9083|nr:DUF2789 domain-containing protein [Stenotrophomonas sp.]HDS0950165.1 DUF2789 domain-containing protein [Stenotrophomonas maltophilia]HDS1027214.1 DUF2789 domain-containing protein [Stenotrophomonas maltophilia]HDS1031190.1 DUF2789 domain-containing protein [Stenotrophomonas maltophilia]HDS1036031.1 DUF2789 domain-containing protein [Stenotrophomonas maltophilia]HDS1038712.1 DUF2789 domain-containing protein [Stenotrophomonas maltophilia]
MITTEPRMTNLFLQLGLDASAEGIAQFIAGHQLATDVEVADAPYWNDAQRQFLAESLQADAAWSTVVDELNEALHEEAVKAATGL